MQQRRRQIFAILYALLFLLAPAFSFGRQASAAACVQQPTSKGTASTSFKVSSQGTYKLWAHVRALSSGSGTFNAMIDNKCPITIGSNDLTAGDFNWLDATSAGASINLTAGEHSIMLSDLSPKIGIDEIMLLSSGSCMPTGDGSNCAAVITNTPGVKSSQSISSQRHTVPALAAAILCIVILFILGLWYFIISKPNSLPGHVFRWAQPKSGKVASSGIKSSTFHARAYRKRMILYGAGLCAIGFILAIIVWGRVDQGIVVSLANAKVSGQAKLMPNGNAATGYFVQEGSATPNVGVPAPQQTSIVATPSSPSPQHGVVSASAVTPASDVTCSYQDDTWSGDASAVGYSVAKTAANDGNPASFSVELNANSSNTEVVGYPSDQCLLYSALPANLVSSYTTTPPTASNGLDYEFAYDIWLTTASSAKSSDWENDLELMIWTYTNGQVPAGSEKSTLPDGSHVWIDGDNKTGIVSVVLPNSASGTVNISSLVGQLKARGYVAANYDGILDLEYGVEAPYGGGKTFTVNSMAVGR